MKIQAPPELMRVLKPFRRRLRLFHTAQGAIWGLAAALLACAGWMVASFFTPIMGLFLRMALTGAAVWAASVLIALFLPAPVTEAARRADACNLKERAVTALSMNADTPMALVQREDAIRHLAALSPKKTIHLLPDKRPIYVSGALAVLILIALFLPNPAGDIAKQREAFKKAMEKQAEKVDKAAQELDEAPYTMEELQKLRKQMGDLSRSLRESVEPRQALLSLDEARRQMESLQKDVSGGAARDAGQSLQQNGMEGLGKALSSQDQQALQQEMEKLENQLKSGKQSASDIAASLAAAAQGMQGGAISDALAAAAQALSQGSNSQQALTALSGQLQDALAGQISGDLSALLSQLRAGTLNAAAQASASGVSGQGQGQGQGQGSGQGSGSGQSQGQGAGGGAGRGTTNEDAGSGGQDGSPPAGPGTNAPEYKIGQYESIYDPTRLNAGEEQYTAQGQMNQGEGQKVQLGPGLGDASGQVPYQQVIGEYKNAASQASQQALLPQNVQQWVDGYFSKLTE